jgi:hypothetical protein
MYYAEKNFTLSSISSTLPETSAQLTPADWTNNRLLGQTIETSAAISRLPQSLTLTLTPIHLYPS